MGQPVYSSRQKLTAGELANWRTVSSVVAMVDILAALGVSVVAFGLEAR